VYQFLSEGTKALARFAPVDVSCFDEAADALFSAFGELLFLASGVWL